MSMKIKTKRHNKTYILKIVGEITGRDVVKIHQKLEALEKSYQGPIAIDLSETTFIDSHGLGVLIYTWKRLEDENRELVFLSPGTFVEQMLKSTKLDKIFRVVGSAEEL